MRMKGKQVIFDTKDMWELDNTLSRVLIPAIEKFLETERHGVKYSILCDIYGPRNEYTEEELEYTDKVFEERLKLLLWTLKGEDEPTPYEGGWVKGSEHGEKTEEGYYKSDLSPAVPEDWEQHCRDLRAWNMKREVGISYLSKHYRDLWC